MYDLVVKKTAQGEQVTGLAEEIEIWASEQLLGYATAKKSTNETYYCADKSLILSPGDVIYVNGIEGIGGWVEIVAFIRDEADSNASDQENTIGVQLYNQGVNDYRNHRFDDALGAFKKCYDAGFYPRQSVYAQSLCQQKLGAAVTLPGEFEDDADRVGTVFISSNLVCKLIDDGYQAALANESAILSIIDGSTYDIRVVSFFGSFMLNAWRKEQGQTIPLSDSNANQTATDRLVYSLVQDASSLPPYPLPEGGLPSSLS